MQQNGVMVKQRKAPEVPSKARGDSEYTLLGELNGSEMDVWKKYAEQSKLVMNESVGRKG